MLFVQSFFTCIQVESYAQRETPFMYVCLVIYARARNVKPEVTDWQPNLFGCSVL